MEHAVQAAPADVHVTFVPTVDDQYRASRALQAGRPLMRLAEYGLPVLAAVNVLMVVATAGWRGLFSGFALVFLPLLAYPALRPLLRRWSLARHRRRNPGMYGAHTFTVSAASVRLEAPNCTVELPWSGIVRARETREQFLLYYSHDCAYFIPRRVLRESDEPRLRALIDERLGSRAGLRTPADRKR